MEQLNKVELRGTVGSIYIKDFGTTRCVNFSVATNYCFKDRDGCPVVETTWHRVLAWENRDTADAFKMKKGDSVHVLGRLRIQRYTGADGVEKVIPDLLHIPSDLPGNYFKKNRTFIKLSISVPWMIYREDLFTSPESRRLARGNYY